MAADFDPRFDPAFQRGYDGAAGPARSVVEPARSVVEPVETARATHPVNEPVETPAAPAASPEIFRYETRGNPWLRALWVVTAAFTVAGLVAEYAAQSMMQGANTSSAMDYYVLPLTVSQLAPWFTVTGLFAGVAALVLNAIRWRPEAQ
jgi:hypothetical protein